MMLKTITFIFIFIITSHLIFTQNVGIGTTNPTTTLHVVKPSGTLDPLRIEGLRLTNTRSHILVVDTTSGLVKHISFDSLSLLIADSINTDNQNLSVYSGGTNTSVLAIENGSDVSIIGGANINLTETSNSITINSIGDGTGTDDQNLSISPGGSNTSILDMENGNNVTFIGGTNVNLTETGNSITINSIGDGTGTDDQNLSVTPGGSNTSVLDMENGNNVTFIGGTNVNLTETSNSITINSIGDGTGSDDQNLSVTPGGSNTSVLDMENGNNITFIGGTNVNLTETSNSITINSIGDGIGTDDQNLSVTSGTINTSVLDMENGNDVTFIAGNNITLTETGNSITISNAGLGNTISWKIVGDPGEPVLQNPWTTVNSSSDNYQLQYGKDGNTVWIRGAIFAAGGFNTYKPVFTLPIGYRPSKKTRMLVRDDGNGNYLKINSNGEVTALDTTDSSGPIFEISFRID